MLMVLQPFALITLLGNFYAILGPSNKAYWTV